MATSKTRKKRSTSRVPTAHRPSSTPPPPIAPQQDDDGPILMPVGTMVKQRWRIERQLTKGAFGQISVARDVETNRLLAVKSEAIDAPMTFLRVEVAVLRALQQKTRQVPRFFACGHTPQVNYVIMQLLGPSIMEMKKKTTDDRFSIGTGVRIVDQMLRALRNLHDIGYLHRDVKPSNFVIGPSNDDARTIFMLDFGLCRQYIDPVTGKQRPPRMRCGFRGTVRYASIDTLKSLDVGRDGDLWSLFYVLLELLNGQLPWRRAYEKHEALEWKESVSPVQLLHGLPDELCVLTDHLQTLDYYARPDYDRIHAAFSALLTKRGTTNDTPMDWEPWLIDEHGDITQKKESGRSEAGQDEETTQVSVKVNEMNE